MKVVTHFLILLVAMALSVFVDSRVHAKTLSLTEQGLNQLFGQGVKLDQAAARRKLEAAAKFSQDETVMRGDSVAATWLALFYANGWGVSVDKIRARLMIGAANKELRTRLAKGDALAQLTVGRLYREGQLVVQNLPYSYRLLNSAATSGNAMAQFYLGYMEQQGLAGAANPKRAYSLYKRSAELGNSYGLYYLGLAYMQGIGTPINRDKASAYITKALEYDNLEARQGIRRFNLVNNSDGTIVPLPKSDRNEVKTLNSSDAQSPDEIAAEKSADSDSSNDSTSLASSERKKPKSTVTNRQPKKPSVTKKPQRMAQSKTVKTNPKQKVPVSDKSSPAKKQSPLKQKPAKINPNFIAATSTMPSPYGSKNATTESNAKALADQQEAAKRLIINPPSVAIMANAGDSIAALTEKSDQGDNAAKLRLATYYYLGQGVLQDYRRAFSLFEQVAASGNSDAQNFIGLLYGSGQGVPLDYKLAMIWYRKAASQGNSNGIYNLALMIENGYSEEVPSSESWRYYHQSAQLGFGLAQYRLAMLYARGEYIEKNSQLSAQWMRKAADSGNADAQFYLGEALLMQSVTVADENDALTWIERAAGQGQPEASKETSQRRAAERGDANEQFKLGSRYYSGDNLLRNMTRAVTWWRKAAINGSSDGAIALGRAYAAGEGVEINYQKSLTALLIAERMNGQDQPLREYLTPRVTKDESDKALDFANNWKIGVQLP